MSLNQRINRREQLLGLLRSREFWTTNQLCEQLSTSHRTLMRDLAELREAGYPLESERGRGGGVRLLGRWGIDKLHLSHREVIEMILALAIVESLKSPLLTDNLHTIRQKIFQAFPEAQRQKVNQIRQRIMVGDQASTMTLETYTHLPHNSLSELVAEAFFECRQIRINYVSESGEHTTRVIEAHYILLNWPVWYVLAWDHLRLAVRLFRFDRIREAEIVDATFKVRKKNEFIDLYGKFFTGI